jgi:multiple sugar transport system substrate-binding protein
VVTNKKYVRRGAALATVALTVAGLAACSSGSDSSTSSAGKNIIIGMNSGLVPQFERYAKDFETANPQFNVTVKAVPDDQATYIQQLVTQGLSKSLPDIIFNYDSLNTTLESNHLLYDIKPWLDSGHDGLKGSDFEQNFLDQYKVGDAVTGIPVSADTGVIAVNETLFKKYDVPIPTADWTLDDMYNDAKKITTASGGSVYGIKTPIGDASGLFNYDPTLDAYGSHLYDPAAKKFTFADPAGIQAWTTLLEPYTQKFGTSYSQANNNNLFPSGQAAMTSLSTAGVASLRSTLKADWDLLPFPTVNGKPTTGGGSYSLSISAKSGNKEGAYKFMAWFYSTDGGMKAASADGVIPATADGIKSGAWIKAAPAVPKSFVPTAQDSISKAVLPTPLPASVQPKLVPALQQAVQEVVLKGESVEKAFTDAQNQLNDDMK